MNFTQPFANGMYNNVWQNQPNYQQSQLYNSQVQSIPQYQQYSQYPQQQMLSGKYVDSVDVVRATEVPMGGSGFFPKADMSEIYVKTWNSDGTTRVLTFRPVVESNEKNQNGSKMEDILTQISELNAKMDKLSADLGG